ncbi:MAG: hypothetical protein HC905_05405 [Bacteroidales bacterium]|nr:hypothetical protein [Bacteroidales bacterium]
MIKIFYSIRAKLLAIIAIIIALFLVSYIMIYNSRYLAGDIVKQASRIKNLQLYPELMRNQFNLFLEKEVINPELYQIEKSPLLDSVGALSKRFSAILDSLDKSGYTGQPLSLGKIKALNQGIIRFQKGNQELLREFMDRGFQQTGRAGNWYRQGEYLENYLAALKNPALLKNWINVRKFEFRYNLDHSHITIEALTGEAIKLKASIASSDVNLTRGIPESDRLRVLSELDKYLEAVLNVRNKDKMLGYGSNEGLIGKQLDLLNTVSAKSKNLGLEIEEQINTHVKSSF